MVDLNRPVFLMLKDLAKVQQEFPGTDSVFPVITINEINNTDYYNIENAEVASDVTFQVDVWDNGDTRENCENLAIEVSKVLTENSFRRTSSKSLKDESGLNRKMMYFNIKIINL